MHKQHIEQSCFLIYATQFIKMIWKSVKPKFSVKYVYFQSRSFLLGIKSGTEITQSLNKTRILSCSIEVSYLSIFVKNHYAPNIFVRSDFKAKQEAECMFTVYDVLMGSTPDYLYMLFRLQNGILINAV
jgi:hypothetical protein